MAGESFEAKRGGDVFTASVSGRTQANGYFLIDMDQGEAMRRHQIQITVKNSSDVAEVPSAGTLVIKVKTPGSSDFEAITNGTIDLTDRTKWLAQIQAYAAEFEFTPASLDSDKTLDVAVISGRD